MKNSLLSYFENKHYATRKIHPAFKPGDSLRVHYKIEETAKTAEGAKKYRTQVFEGVCIRYRKGIADASFCVRKIGANSVGVERHFPLYSPMIEKVELISAGRVRRARLYYLRELTGRAARIRAKRIPTGMIVTSQEQPA